jgi:hypothetical protein
VTHGEDVVVAVAEQHLRHGARRQQRRQRLHHFLFTVDAVEVTEPGVARAQLWPRLLQDEQPLGRLDAQHGVGDAAAERLDAHRPGPDPALAAQVVGGVVGAQLQHGERSSAQGRRSA